MKDTITFTKDQERALEVFRSKKNMLLTGEAGTGKSFVIAEMVSSAPGVAVTATTGLAASVLGGRTINSWAGLGLMDGPARTILAKMPRGAESRIMKVDILILDEVSMASAEMIDILDQAFKEVRQCDKPFGGIQMVFVGDFHQLPPVKSDEFAFDSKAWKEADIEIVCLKEIVRQSDDAFKIILGALRTGNITGINFKPLTDRTKAIAPDDTPILESKNKDVDRFNETCLNQIDGDEIRIRSADFGAEWYLQNCPLPEVLKLKKGARVMCRINLTEKIFNGKAGIVTDFEKLDGEVQAVEVKFDGVSSSVRVPLHTVNITEGFEWREVEESPLECGYMVDKYGIHYKESACEERNGKMQIYTAKIVARRTQIPLTLGWAITIHKSQGMTLDSANVKLHGTFAPGQVYVALSRVKTLEGLYIDKIPKIKVHGRVKEFYEA